VYVSAMGQVIGTGRRRRRHHSAEFKSEAVGACQQPGVSIAAVALARGLNASVLHRWVREAERRNNPIAIRPTMPSAGIEMGAGFVPVPMRANPAEGTIRIKVRRRGGMVSIEWPASVAHECALLLRELLR
jgi:transposase